MSSIRTVVLGDLHLTRATPRIVTQDLASVIDDHRGARIVLNGDLFDLSAQSPRLPPERAVKTVLAAHPTVKAALGLHVERGGQLWLIAGNHDAELSNASFQAALLDALALRGDARERIRFTPWFFRDGAVHFEHGHLYDPDNAPAHPLVNGAPSLGVHFTEQFIAKTGAFAYLNANDGTPLTLFLSSFRWYGRRAPYVIYRYFLAATAALLRSGPLYRAGGEKPAGDALSDLFASEVGVPRAMLDELMRLGPTPTLESLARTFTRLYLDRVLASTALVGGLGSLALGRTKTATAALATGALLMGASWSRGHDRYQGTVAERLATSAAHVAGATGAKLVIFGHTHREALSDGYANTASFSFPVARDRGRPFLEIEGSAEAPRAVRRYWTGIRA
jgi:UDP-2,3-diacylglucosamine pyrophosphatase LpxH